MDKVQELKQKIEDLKNELKDQGKMTDDPKCAALCETSSEVLAGLDKAFEHYINKSEEAWK